MNPDYSHCLRPIFTEQVVEKLLNDTSLNPFGEEGMGKKRLLDDLMALAAQKNIAVIRLNMKAYSNSYASFLRQTELDLNKLVPADPSRVALMDGKMDLPTEALPCLSELLDHTGVVIHQPLWILIEQLDALIYPNVHDFPMKFFDDLNFIKNNTKATLCCTTVATHKNSELGDKETRRTSFLELLPIDIPLLDMAEIRTVLNKRLKDNDNWQKNSDKEVLIGAISKTQAPVIFVELLIEDFSNSKFKPCTPRKRMKNYKKQYQKRYKDTHQTFEARWKYWMEKLKDLITIKQLNK